MDIQFVLTDPSVRAASRAAEFQKYWDKIAGYKGKKVKDSQVNLDQVSQIGLPTEEEEQEGGNEGND